MRKENRLSNFPLFNIVLTKKKIRFRFKIDSSHSPGIDSYDWRDQKPRFAKKKKKKCWTIPLNVVYQRHGTLEIKRGLSLSWTKVKVQTAVRLLQCSPQHTHTLYLYTHRRTSHASEEACPGTSDPMLENMDWRDARTRSLCSRLVFSRSSSRLMSSVCLSAHALGCLCSEIFLRNEFRRPEVSLLMPFYYELCVILV